MAILKFDEFASTEANGETFYKYMEYLATVLISPDLNFVELYEVLAGEKLDIGDKINNNSDLSFTGLPLAPLKAGEGLKVQDDIEIIDIIEEPKPELVVEVELEDDDEEKVSGCFSGILKRFRGGGKKKFWSGWFGKKKKKMEIDLL